MKFAKYQGTGNDFIIVDTRFEEPGNINVKQLCDRHKGIGADGLILLRHLPGYDFKMVYYNSDGNLSSMCGNGGRCIALFAKNLGIGVGNSVRFMSVDGTHKAIVSKDYVELSMGDVRHWEKRGEDTFVLNTGSPHYVVFTKDDPANTDLDSFAKAIRYNEEFSAVGINVNLVQIISDNTLKMRTYERGVEGETDSCGTGVTAAAICLQIFQNKPVETIHVQTKGGKLDVKSQFDHEAYTNIWLCGPAMKVFEGTT